MRMLRQPDFAAYVTFSEAIHICKHASIYARIYICRCIKICMCVCVCIYMNVCICIHIDWSMYIDIDTDIYMYT